MNRYLITAAVLCVAAPAYAAPKLGICPGEYALCAASSTEATGKTITFANAVPYSSGGSFVYSQGVGIQSVTVSYTANASTGVQQVQVIISADLSGVDAYISRGSFSVPACILVAVNGFSAPVCSSVGITFNKATGDIYFDKTPMQQGFGGTSVAFTLNGSLTFPPF